MLLTSQVKSKVTNINFGKELDMKKRTFISFLFLCAAVAVINSETNFFLDIGDYIPALEENAPEAVRVIS